jgi:amino acid transporter
LIRAISVHLLAASIVNVTIGASIFVLPASVAAGLGSAAPVAYVVCATLMTLIVMCFAAAGSRISLMGGLYAYMEVAFRGFVGLTCGVLYWPQMLFSVASVASSSTGWPFQLLAIGKSAYHKEREPAPAGPNASDGILSQNTNYAGKNTDPP